MDDTTGQQENSLVQATVRGGCHCGAIEIEIDLPQQSIRPRRCNCSLCSTRNALMIGVPLAALRVVRGKSSLNLYQWNTEVARHYFCGNCGVYTHHQRRSDPNEYAVNVSCLELNAHRLLPDIEYLDGAANSLVNADDRP
jgi:hypothetical protein